MRAAAKRSVKPVELGEHGVIRVPSRFRRAHRLKKGSQLLLVEVGNALVMVPPDPVFDSLSQRLQNTLAKAGVTLEALLKGLPKERKRLFTERYGKI
jgi:bifunctional DNA-binding transcriptional regulator/antitoxin component of YhaV-PrlF toxin-antitoxin module